MQAETSPPTPPSPKPPLILTLDIGTSSIRAMLFDSQARAVPGCLAQVPCRPQTVSGSMQFDGETLFAGVIQAIDQILAQAGPLAREIGGVAADTLVTNIMGLDAAGQIITPLYTYADIRNAADAQALRDKFGPAGVAAIHDRTGCLVHAAYLPARFRWLARAQPDLLARVAHWVSIGEYIYGRLFGRWGVSYSVAAWTGLLNRRELRWDQAWLAELPIGEDLLSPLVDVNQPIIGLKQEWAERWPPLKDIPWFPAIGDGAAANMGSGCDRPDRVALTLGTTGAMRVVVIDAISTVPDGLWLYRVDGRRALLGGATTEGGNLFAWLNQTLKLPGEAELEEALARRTPAAHGLTVLPFVAGERAPGWHDDARASIIGFTLDTQPLDLVRAGLESVAYRFALIYQRIRPHLPAEHQHQIIASGGAILSSPTWLQIMADVLGQPVLTLAEAEATSRGIALLALEALDIIEDTANLPPTTGRTYEPNPEHHQLYRDGLAEQVRLYDLLVRE